MPQKWKKQVLELGKEKVSVTIDGALLVWLDSQIKKKKYASRSHGFEYALNELKETSS